MFCPKCRSEYRDGFTVCADCNTDLVKDLPPEPEVEYTDLVTVLQPTDEAAVALAQSILNGAGIHYIAKGEGIQDLFAWGRVGAGFNPMLGPVEIQVAPEDADRARELLGAEGLDTVE